MHTPTDKEKERQETLKGIIKDLHAGAQVEEIKARFGELLEEVGPSEIGEIEQSLIEEGLPVEEIQKLCDIHVAVFKESLEKQKAAQELPVFPEEEPVVSLQKENERIGVLVQEIRSVVQQIKGRKPGADIAVLLQKWRSDHERLLEVDRHYARKENILFPYLERYGISGPPAVMWGIHDEIRASLKEVTQIIAKVDKPKASSELALAIGDHVLPVLSAISEMIYKEENILFPMCKDTLDQEDWAEIGVQLRDPFAAVSKPPTSLVKTAEGVEMIELEIGSLSPEQINLLLTHLPVDLTFVDENDEVRFFSVGPERIFERTRAVIGRKVQNCHPPASLGVVNKILADFRSGRQDHADFWINKQGQLIYIRYFAVRDAQGAYKGALEVTQNVTAIQSLTGEKRIFDQ